MIGCIFETEMCVLTIYKTSSITKKYFYTEKMYISSNKIRYGENSPAPESPTGQVANASYFGINFWHKVAPEICPQTEIPLQIYADLGSK